MTDKIAFKAIPTFRILDYTKAINFYVEGLGFNVDWEHRFGKKEPVYMQVSLHKLVIHLTENKRFKPGAIVFIESNRLMEFYKELISSKTNIKLTEPEKTNWNTIQMEIEDPFNNLLRFNQNIVE